MPAEEKVREVVENIMLRESKGESVQGKGDALQKAEYYFNTIFNTQEVKLDPDLVIEYTNISVRLKREEGMSA